MPPTIPTETDSRNVFGPSALAVSGSSRSMHRRRAVGTVVTQTADRGGETNGGTMMKKLLTSGAAIAALLFLFAGCGDDDTDAGDDAGADGATTVDVTLQDFDIALSDTTVPAGEVTFAVQNDGPSVHEFVILKTDAAPGDLPTEDGDVAEDEVEAVDEIEDIDADSAPELSADLEPGHYVVICNLPGHYKQGMNAEFTVE